MDTIQREEIERRLLRERERALRVLHRVQDETRRSLDWTNGTRPGYREESVDLSAEAVEREQAFALASKATDHLHQVEAALRLLYEHPESFGRCQGCGTEIPFERLYALPYTRSCLACRVREETAQAA